MKKILWLAAGLIILQIPPVSAEGLFQQGQDLLGKTGLKSGSSSTQAKSAPAGLSQGEIGSGLIAALKIGANKAAAKVGRPDGFLKDPAIHIPLPGPIAKAQPALRMVGASGLADDLEVRLNRAAEQAAPVAKDVVLKAISQMSFSDATGILTGGSTAATDYLKEKSKAPLTEKIGPIVSKAMAGSGAAASYEKLNDKVSGIPMAPNIKTNLNQYIAEKTLDGLFHYIGTEETALRANPLSSGSALVSKVFGSVK